MTLTFPASSPGTFMVMVSQRDSQQLSVSVNFHTNKKANNSLLRVFVLILLLLGTYITHFHQKISWKRNFYEQVLPILMKFIFIVKGLNLRRILKEKEYSNMNLCPRGGLIGSLQYLSDSLGESKLRF